MAKIGNWELVFVIDKGRTVLIPALSRRTMAKIIGAHHDVSVAPLATATGPLFDSYPYGDPPSDVVHWRMGDFARTLLDLTVRSDNGAIIGVTLTIFGGPILRELPYVLLTTNCIAAVPKVDVTAMPSTPLDEPRRISMHIASDTIYLVIDADQTNVTCFEANRVRYFVADTKLVGLAFGPLSAEERASIIAILQSTGTLKAI